MKNEASLYAAFSFKKGERLCSKKLIDELFKTGSSFYLHPYKILYLQKDFQLKFPAQVLVTVPAKNFKKAVDRNNIKRLTREAYRQKKPSFYNSLQSQDRQLLIGFIYTAKNIEPYALIDERISAALNRLLQINQRSEIAE